MYIFLTCKYIHIFKLVIYIYIYIHMYIVGPTGEPSYGSEETALNFICCGAQ